MFLSEQLARKPVVVLDGAMGTELFRHGVDLSLPLWSANALIRAPHLVRNIHFWNLHAGADVLTANTFRTNLRALRAAGVEARWEEFNLKALEFAFEARERYRAARPVTLAASLAPVEDCYRPDLAPSDEELAEEHGRQAELLALLGAELLLVCTADGRLLSGEDLAAAVTAVLAHGPVALLVNCVSAASMLGPLTLLRAATVLPVGCYANAGTPVGGGTCTRQDLTDDAHVEEAGRWVSMGARIVGGCCGISPALLARIAGRIAPMAAEFIAQGIHRHAPLPPELAAVLAAQLPATEIEGEHAA